MTEEQTKVEEEFFDNSTPYKRLSHMTRTRNPDDSRRLQALTTLREMQEEDMKLFEFNEEHSRLLKQRRFLRVFIRCLWFFIAIDLAYGLWVTFR
ncbi:hypothetical protein ACFYKX_11370 [Cytobacillus sp. FJAT-54145]|uniref:Transmembrane protein n=1 Tax=Cytobacillus spartinae TaxID=3299023 RepID=A0ABW6KD62_9BACI